jgi:hypothetical protein
LDALAAAAALLGGPPLGPNQLIPEGEEQEEIDDAFEMAAMVNVLDNFLAEVGGDAPADGPASVEDSDSDDTTGSSADAPRGALSDAGDAHEDDL